MRHVNSQNLDLQLICKKAPRHGHSLGVKVASAAVIFSPLDSTLTADKQPDWQLPILNMTHFPPGLSDCQVVRLSGCQVFRLSGCLLGAPEQAPPGRGGAAAGPAAAGQSVAHQSPNDGGGEEGSRSSRPPSRCPSCPAARSPWHQGPPTD